MIERLDTPTEKQDLETFAALRPAADQGIPEVPGTVWDSRKAQLMARIPFPIRTEIWRGPIEEYSSSETIFEIEFDINDYNLPIDPSLDPERRAQLNNRMNNEIFSMLEPFSELYDMNPKKFYAMDHAEFLENVRFYDFIKCKKEDIQTKLSEINNWLDMINGYLDGDDDDKQKPKIIFPDVLKKLAISTVEIIQTQFEMYSDEMYINEQDYKEATEYLLGEINGTYEVNLNDGIRTIFESHIRLLGELRDWCVKNLKHIDTQIKEMAE